jgi:hypothetical protein
MLRHDAPGDAIGGESLDPSSCRPSARPACRR